MPDENPPLEAYASEFAAASTVRPINQESAELLDKEKLLEPYVKAPSLDGVRFDRVWIVEGLFEKGRIIEIYGAWKSGKTLVALDMAGHLSVGKTWAGRRTVPAVVVYVAGEAVEDVQARLAGWMTKNDHAGGLPFYIRIKPAYITNETYAHLLFREVEHIKTLHPDLPVVVVIDTLARNFGPGVSENSDDGMGAFVNNLIDVIARPLQATVLVVHHTGHSDKDRGRGHSSFEAAVDGALKVTIDKAGGSARVTVKMMLSRATEGDDAFSFEIETQEELPGEDNFGNGVEVPVLRHAGDEPEKPQEWRPGQNQQKIISLLGDMYQARERRINEGALSTEMDPKIWTVA